MPEAPGPRAANPLLVLMVAALMMVIFFNVLATGFEKLGMARGVVAVVFGASLAGSLVNIPLWHRELKREASLAFRLGPRVYYRRPVIEHQVVAVNVGGAIVPMCVSAWLLGQASLFDIGVTTLAVTAAVHAVARVVPGKGISMPVFVGPAVAAALAVWLASDGSAGEPAAVAYAGGSIGTLLGADILNLRRIYQVGPGIASIGGAGVFDGIFLVGLVAALLA